MCLPPLRTAWKKMPPTWTRREFQIYALEERISNLYLRVETWFQTQHAETHYEKEPHDSEPRVSEFTT